MKTCNLSLATVVLGTLAVSYSACSAEGQDNSVPGAPTSNVIPTGQAGSVSSSGSVGVPAGGSSGATTHPTPSAGAPAAVGGRFNTGVGGATTSVGRAGAPATGGAGAPTSGGCKTAVGTAADLLIDDMEDGDNAIRPIGARTGYWFTYNDGTAAQLPSGTVFMPAAGVGSTATSLKFAQTSGPAFMTWGAGIGFDFNNNLTKSCTYDASAYTGIKFWAKGNVAIRAMVKVPGTTAKKANGSDAGTCVATATMLCDDHFALTPSPVLTAAWQQYSIDFSGTATFAQEGWGTKVAFDKKNIIAMQFQVAKALAFDFSIDDITFYK
ncbi:MAG TPA: hypothetical protein VJV79_31290 [Polyangiaceae bacterium]|nr:hypothetical protein [Polyangiaceae bacterium]